MDKVRQRPDFVERKHHFLFGSLWELALSLLEDGSELGRHEILQNQDQ
jgi:hypothetical protein